MNCKSKGIHNIVLFTMLLLPEKLLAENIDSFELSPEQLFSAEVITVSRTSETLADIPAAVYVITSEDIRRSGHTAIPEILRMAPGVDVARVNTGGWAISIRGFNGTLANKLLVLIDGREVYDPLFSGVYWDIQDIPLADIDRIEVVRGPGASFWGANAVNGVINILTKSAFDTEGNYIRATTGNKERALVAARHGGSLGEDGAYRIYGKSFYRENQQGLGDASSNDDWKAYRSGFRADWQNSENQSNFSLQNSAYHNRSNQMRTVYDLEAPFANVIEEKILARGTHLLGRWNKISQNNSNITVSSYVDYTSRNQAALNNDRITYDLDGQYEFPEWMGNQLIVGGKYRFINDQFEQSEFEPVVFSESSQNNDILSGFIHDKITLVPEKWFLTLGSKFSHNDYTGVEIEPELRLQWYPDNTQILWGSVSRGVRIPSTLENDLHLVLAAASVGVDVLSVDTFPNRNLASEELTAYELGYRKQLTSEILLDIAAFYNDYGEIINFTPQALLLPPPRFIIPLIPLNNGTAETYGAEAVLNWRVSRELKLSAAYSLLKMEIDEPRFANSASNEEVSPENQFNIRALWDVTDRISFDTSLYYVSKLKAFNVKSYTRLDMRIGYNIADGVELSLVGQNLFDDAHQEFTSPTDVSAFPAEINRSIYGNITWSF